jgi:hypothetical protein
MHRALTARVDAEFGFYTNGSAHREWQALMRDVPPGIQLLLLRRMICLDLELTPVPTSVVESVQVRMVSPDKSTGPSQVFEEFDLQRQLLFAGKQGGLRAILKDEPRPGGYSALGRLSTDPRGRVAPLVPFPRNCAECHIAPLPPEGGAHAARPPVIQSFMVFSTAERQDRARSESRAVRWKMEREELRLLRELAGSPSK